MTTTTNFHEARRITPSAAASAAASASAAVPADVVPENLLAMAKDSRYIEDCKQLLLKVLPRFLRVVGIENNNNNDNSADRGVDRIATLLSSVLYCLTVLRRHPIGESLGMQACGLTYDNHDHKSSQKWKVLASSLGTAIAVYAVQHVVAAAVGREETFLNDDGDGDSRTAANEAAITAVESLRGEQRRQYFEQQHRAMLERAKNADVVEVSSSSTAAAATVAPVQRRPVPHDSSSSSSATRTRLRRFALWLLQQLNEPGLASWNYDGGGGGPHSLVIPQQQQHPQGSRSLGSWLLRLHLAFYCLNGGRYPSWRHRLFGLTVIPKKQQQKQQSGNENDNNSLLFRSTTNLRVIGLLILAQATGALVPAVARQVLRWIMTRKVQQQQQIDGGDNNMTSFSSLHERSRQHLQFGISFTDQTPENANATSNTLVVSDDDDTNVLTAAADAAGPCCVICRCRFRHPACPKSCGHVFCWTCLQQWVSSVRPECPCCRAPCRPQDVVALYNY